MTITYGGMDRASMIAGHIDIDGCKPRKSQNTDVSPGGMLAHDVVVQFQSG